MNLQNAYALLIGVGYDLPVTSKDAKAVSAHLSNPHIAGYPEENIILLTDEEATAEMVRQGFDQLLSRLPSDGAATVFIYYSGHGELVQSRSGVAAEYYMKCYGYDDYDRANTMLTGDEFASYIQRISARKLLVFLDCCHADGMNDGKEFLKVPSPRWLISSLDQGKGRMYISSCDDDEKSLILNGHENSLFTTCLLEALEGYNSRGEEYVHAVDVLSYLVREVNERLKDDESLEQHPVISEVKDMDPNFFVCKNSKAKGVQGIFQRVLNWAGKRVVETDLSSLDEQLAFLLENCHVQKELPEFMRSDAYKKKKETQNG